MGSAAGGAAGAAGATGGLAGAASAATPWVTMGLGAVNMATDLMQAGKQADASRAAQQAAEVAARKEEQLRSQDMFQALQAPMEQYNRAGREITSQVGQAVSALQEGDSRNLAGGLGKIVGAGIEGEADTRDAAANELYRIGVAQAQSGMNVNADLADLEAQRLAGAQTAGAAANQAELGLLSGAAQAGAGLINQGLGMIPSFGEKKVAPQTQTPAQMAQTAAYYNQNPPAMSSGFGQSTPSTPSWMSSLSFLNKPQ
jgi:hypothetical protein